MSRNLVKPFFIAGFIAGELYVAALLLAPAAPGHPGVHWSGAVTAALLFGPFGGAAGGGVGLLVMALLSVVSKVRGGRKGESTAAPDFPAYTSLRSSDDSAGPVITLPQGEKREP